MNIPRVLPYLLVAGVVLLAWRALPAHAAAALPRVNPAQYTAKQWSDTFATVAELPVAQRAAVWADLAGVDAVYVRDPLGEGPGAVPDADPLLDFTHVDCQTYVEQVYALALAHARTEVDDLLRRIRYTDGKVDYRWRNHYTVTDWLPANAWCLRDVTDEVGGGMTQPMTKTISHATFFADKGLTQYKDLPDITQTTNYIPREKIADVAGKLRTGDMAIFVIDAPGIIAGHVGILRNPGVLSVEHASLSAGKVVTSPLVDYVTHLPARFVGVKFARLVEQR